MIIVPFFVPEGDIVMVVGDVIEPGPRYGMYSVAQIASADPEPEPLATCTMPVEDFREAVLFPVRLLVPFPFSPLPLSLPLWLGPPVPLKRVPLLPPPVGDAVTKMVVT